MNDLQLRATVGADGVLSLQVPLGIGEANHEFKVTLERVDSSEDLDDEADEQWRESLDTVLGRITDPTFRRHEQGELDEPPMMP